MLIAQTLAELAADAYSQNPAKGLPAGFSAVNLPGLNMHNGLFQNGPAEAVVSIGMIDGQTVLSLAFRGSDDKADWSNDLTGINNEYKLFQPLVQAVENYAAAGGHVVVEGHSLGGAMTQIFMSEHPGDDHYRAATFGSPGALPQAGVFTAEADSRITNYAISDDPFVFLGEHRLEAANLASSNPAFDAALTTDLAAWTPLSAKQVSADLSYLTADYANNGAVVTLPGELGHIGFDNWSSADPAEHDIAAYLGLVGSAADPVLWS